MTFLKFAEWHRCPKYFFLVYPDKETAQIGAVEAGLVSRTPAREAAMAGAEYWTGQFGKPVLVCPANQPFLVLTTEEDSQFVKILYSETVGWIILAYWLKFEEVTEESS